MSAHPPVAVFDNFWATTLAFARSLGRQRVPLHFYGNGAGRWSRYSARHSACPPVEDAARFEPWLLEKIRSGEIARIAPTTDLIAYYTSKYREEFPHDVQRSIAPLAEIEVCLIKTRFALVSWIEGHPSLATASPESLDGAIDAAVQLGYPVILKPKSHLVVGFAERGVLIKTAEQLARYFRPYVVTRGQERLAQEYPELLWPLMQRYIPSARLRVYSVTGIKDAQGGVLAAAVSYKCEQWPPHVGISTVQVSSNDERILAAGLQVVERILSRGIFEVELLADGHHLFAIDLNPRAFGFVALDIARGFDLPWLWFRSTLARQAAVPQQPSEVVFEARHGLLHLLRRMANPHMNGAEPTLNADSLGDSALPRGPKSNALTRIPMLGTWSDPIPMLICHLHLLRHPRSLLLAQRTQAR